MAERKLWHKLLQQYGQEAVSPEVSLLTLAVSYRQLNRYPQSIRVLSHGSLCPSHSNTSSGIAKDALRRAWIEASTKGAVLLFTAAEVENRTVAFGLSPATAGLLGGMSGGIVQAYATMGFCTSAQARTIGIEVFLLMPMSDVAMKTAEITRHKALAVPGAPPPPSTWKGERHSDARVTISY